MQYISSAIREVTCRFSSKSHSIISWLTADYYRWLTADMSSHQSINNLARASPRLISRYTARLDFSINNLHKSPNTMDHEITNDIYCLLNWTSKVSIKWLDTILFRSMVTRVDFLVPFNWYFHLIESLYPFWGARLMNGFGIAGYLNGYRALGSTTKDPGSYPRHAKQPLWEWAPHIIPSSCWTPTVRMSSSHNS